MPIGRKAETEGGATVPRKRRAFAAGEGGTRIAKPAGFLHGASPMGTERVFRVADHLQPADGEPIRSVVVQTPDATVVAWTVRRGQRIAAHVHPQGQDTWTVLSGTGEYQLDVGGSTRTLGPGDIAVAPVGAVHGVLATGEVPLVFVSVVCPGEAGYALA
jgi:quercetin dioxygenase-like cupin family protein